ncbi:MAG: 50S ribosomal protein L11 methyltransferase [Stappia sp.]|uniref:50S ribosomal protein L11 methyltransferase n=1 Tax=Stappia sp. TaxID=1870903 RepID=UPI000C57B905|nr:50S ribosomal protein L11 methyltransferase [Stappia sp.]MAA97382.1 50S ribosomal protein L11 methyltransferase [Stappia sp.]MBM21915.1 50S ribosomal protein L11 methyltransferase [Stappia sp.]
MSTIRVRITAEEIEAKRIYELLARDFEDDGNPVTVFESSADGLQWTAEILLFEMTPDEATDLVRDRLGADAFAAPMEAVELDDINWVEKSLEGLAPVVAGRFFVHGSHDRYRRPFHGISMEIEAALAFGTGHHGTTSGCLAELDRLLTRRRYRKMLDLGTGTGVLAIALARTSRQKILASDIDPVATLTAKANAIQNLAGPFVKCVTAAGVEARVFAEDGPFDLVVANILARPLMQMAKGLGACMARDATLVLSGLRIEDGPRIIFAYGTQGFRLARRGERDGWLTLTFVRGRHKA